MAQVSAGRRARRRRYLLVCAVLAVLILVTVAVSLLFGRQTFSPAEVIRVLLGEQVPGASFTVGVLRLPRALVGALAGAAFGMAGITFQTMLRNPLASPDIIGISSGASAAAVFCIVLLSMSETAVSIVATLAALVTAGVIYLLSFRDGLSGTRLILIGIGISAMLQSVVSYVLSRAAQWDLQTAMRWLNGNLNGSTMDQVLPLVVAVVVAGAVLALLAKSLDALRLGEETSAALGVRVERTRVLLILFSVTLLAFATAAAGPVAFVAFLAGPISVRLLGSAGSAGSPLLPAALVGALLILVADFAGQFAFGTRYPVGVITGVLGAPYLIYLLIRSTRTGGAQ
nr:iron chelate uptake ABC transporter family permease subunit [Brevibacterium senegalense]